MSLHCNPPSQADDAGRFARYARYWGLAVVLLALYSLARWIAPAAIIESHQPLGRHTTPLTALALLCAALSVCLHASSPEAGSLPARTWYRRAARLFALVPLCIGALKLADYTLHHHSELELLGFGAKWIGASPPRMAHVTAFTHVLLGIALWCVGRRGWAGLCQGLAMLSAIIGWLALAQYIYGGTMPLPFEPVSYSAAASFLLLSVGILLLEAGKGWMRLVVSPTAGGQLFRRFLPGLAVPFVLGWLRLEAQRAGWVGLESGLSMFALANVLIFAGLIWMNARILDRADEARRRAEADAQARAEDQSLLAAIVSSSDDAIIGKTLDGIVTSWNHGAERIFGYTEAETVGSPSLMLIPPDRLDEETRILERIGAGGSVEHFESVRIRKDGQVIQIAGTISPIRDAAGTIVGASKIVRDVTERRRAAEALRKGEARFQTVLANMSEGLVLADLQGNLLHWNPAALAMHGFESDEEWRRQLGDFVNIFQLSTPAGVEIPFEQWPMPRIFRGERVRNYEVRLRSLRDEWERIFSYSGEIVQTPEGEQIAFITFTDITAHIEAQRSLLLFRTLVDNSNDSFEVVDPESARFLDINERGSSSVGYTREEFLRLRVFDLDPSLNPSDWERAVAALRRKKAAIAEGIHRCKDGSTFPVEVNLRWVELDRPYIVSVVRDISERRRAEEALRESEHRFRQMTETLPQMVWTCNPAGECDYLSPQWTEYVGDASGDLGFGWVRRVHPEDRPALVRAWEAAVQQKQMFDQEFRIQRHDGAFRWFKTRAVPLRNSAGEIVKWFGTNTDIHALRELRENLKATQARLQYTLEMGRIGTFSVDLEQNRTDWDASLVKLYGRTWNDADGANPGPFLACVEPEDRPAIAASLRRLIEEGETAQREFRYRRPDGTILWLASRVAPEHDDSGRVRRLMGVCVDISERIEGEEVRLHNAELEIENRKVQEANRLKSEFLANMSHELRTPLNGIIGFTEFLIDGRPGELNPKQLEYLTDVYHSSQHLLQLINDVLDLSKIESGKMALLATRFNPRKAIEQVCAVVKGMADKQHVSVTHEVDPTLEEVFLDEQKFKQILYNLLSNAVKFTDAGGRAEVRADSLPGERLRLQVTDTGIGIKEQDLPKLFQEFVQIESGASRRFEGTGLGLALTRKLVELHEGDISVASEFGRGSTFTVILPKICKAAVNQ